MFGHVRYAPHERARAETFTNVATENHTGRGRAVNVCGFSEHRPLDRWEHAMRYSTRPMKLSSSLWSRYAAEDESAVKPKPMVENGGRPLLWHIMTHYARYGFKGSAWRWGTKATSSSVLRDYALLNGSRPSTSRPEDSRRGTTLEDWTVHLVPTGQDTSPVAASSACSRLTARRHGEPR